MIYLVKTSDDAGRTWQILGSDPAFTEGAGYDSAEVALLVMRDCARGALRGRVAVFSEDGVQLAALIGDES